MYVCMYEIRDGQDPVKCMYVCMYELVSLSNISKLL